MFLNKYEIIAEEKIQQGGQAKVFACIDVHSQEQVAVKTTKLENPQLVKSFQREVKALSRLDNNGIIQILDYEIENDVGIVVMPWLENNLDDFLFNNSSLKPVEKLMNIIMPIANALAYAHENKVFHRDIKPSNILMDFTSSPVISDFGAAKLFGPQENELTNLEWISGVYTPEVQGTPAQHDVYSFGILSLEILTKIRPKNRDHALTLLGTKSGEKEIISTETKGIIEKCLALDPKERFSSAIELNYALLQRSRNVLKNQNRTKYFAWIKLEDRVRSKLLPLAEGFINLDLALKKEFSNNLYASPILNQDGTYNKKEFWLISDQMKLHLVANSQKTGWTAVQGNLATSEELEFYRRTCLDISSFGIDWGVNSISSQLNKHSEGFRYLTHEFSEWINNGRPSGEMSQYVHVEIEKLASKWGKILDAREEAAVQNFTPLKYKNACIDGLRISLELEDPIDDDLCGSFWKIEFANSEVAEIVAHVGSDLEMLLTRDPRGKIKKSGQLVPELEAGEASQLRKQRDAINSLLKRTSVQPKLGDLLANLSQTPRFTPKSVQEWKNAKLDDSKRQTVEKALGTKNFLLVQGPPGTGKTSFIAEYVHQELSRNPGARILLVSQTHVALDNALERLLENGVVDCVRLGTADDIRIATSSKKLLIDAQMQIWMKELRANSNGFIDRHAKDLGIDLEDARALLTIYELDEVQTTINSLKKEISERDSSQFSDAGSHPEASLTSLELLKIKTQDEERLYLKLRDQLANKLTLPKNAVGLDLDHIRGALLGSKRVTQEFIKLVDTQAKWLERVGSSSQLTSVFLQTRRVLAGTCLGFMSHPAVRELEFDICIIDEASRATISQALVSMVRSSKWIVVGDSNQLSTTEIELNSRESQDILKKYELNPDDVEESIFAFLEKELPSTAQTSLNVQYRMRDEIGQMISDLFYSGQLDSSGPKLDSKISAYFPAVIWSDTSDYPTKEKSEFRDKTSFSNRNEILVIRDKLKQLRNYIDLGLLKPDKPYEILIIAPYAAQIIQAKSIITNLKEYPFNIEFNSIDAVQGREADIVYFSCVRQNERGDVGFLNAKNWRRINVALSRARYSVNIVGDKDFWAGTSSALSNVVRYIGEQNSSAFQIVGRESD